MVKATTTQQKNLMYSTIWPDIIVEFVALPGILLCCKFKLNFWQHIDEIRIIMMMIKLIFYLYQFNADLVDVAHVIDFVYKGANLTFSLGTWWE